MPNLSEQLEEVRRGSGARSPFPSGCTVTLEPSAFLEEFPGKPMYPIVLGLKTPNDSDYAEALSRDTEREIMNTLVSVGMCDPNDCREPHPSFPCADEEIAIQLKPETIRYLYDRIEQLHLETCPTIPLATDDELFLLGDALLLGEQLGELSKVNLAAANRVRRLASVLMQALGVAEEVETDVATAIP